MPRKCVDILKNSENYLPSSINSGAISLNSNTFNENEMKPYDESGLVLSIYEMKSRKEGEGKGGDRR